jgi:hypothetical protein
MLSANELARTLDIFPLEYAAIAADHLVIRGTDPFAALTVAPEDLRRAVEAQAKSHLIHLREAYLETRGETTRIAQLITASAGALRALLTNIVRLTAGSTGTLADPALADAAERTMGTSPGVIREVLAASAEGPSSVTDPTHLLSRYLEATYRIWEFVDGWR